jgi:hypothetical protein
VPTGAVGTVVDGLTLKGDPYKLADDVIRSIIGPTENFDILADQNGYNSSYSTGNYEYVVLRNYLSRLRPRRQSYTLFPRLRWEKEVRLWANSRN